MFNREEILERLYPLLKIRSVKDTPQENAPFGEGAKKALDYVLTLADSMGFETVNYDNYIGEVVFGKGKPFGVLCHLDVVPEGELSAWITPPYEPTIRDGKLFCRGAVDDKSPVISVLSAMYEMKKQGLEPKRQIRLILGCDEESGWGCIDHYNECATLPEEGISPDADFPVIYAEKGIIHLTYKFKKLGNFKACGGVKANVVCDKAVAEGDFTNAVDNGKKGEISAYSAVFRGKTAHGSTPDKGDNAIKYMTAFLEENGLLEKGVTDKLFGACEGAKELCDETGNLTFSPNIVKTDDEYIYYTVDCRYPSTLDREFVESNLKRIGEYEVDHVSLPLFVDKNSKLVKSLIDIYNEVMGTNAEPIAIGGGTYARALKSAVAFGPCIGEEGDTVHMPNEYITLDTLMKMTEIYYKALVKLCVE